MRRSQYSIHSVCILSFHHNPSLSFHSNFVVVHVFTQPHPSYILVLVMLGGESICLLARHQSILCLRDLGLD